MTECWSTGDLRAAIDRELPPETLQRIAAHLEECGKCRAEHAELAARAARVMASVEELISVPRPVRATVKTTHGLRWAVPLALAAGLAIGWMVLPKRTAPPATPPAKHVAVVPAQKPLEQSTAEAVPPTPRRVLPRPVRTTARRARPETVDFVALDDRPIDNGVVMRVSWGPENLQADIIFGPDGSARAYRLVNANYRH